MGMSNSFFNYGGMTPFYPSYPLIPSFPWQNSAGCATCNSRDIKLS